MEKGAERGRDIKVVTLGRESKKKVIDSPEIRDYKKIKEKGE